MKPKITMKALENNLITSHDFDSFDCLLVYEKRDRDVPVLIIIMELMRNISGTDIQNYILVNYVDGSTRGVCASYAESWEKFLEEYFLEPNEFDYSYKCEGKDYIVNEEYNFK